MGRIRIIAEIGCNHNGDVNLAKKMIDEAVACGADAVKFQTFEASALVAEYAPCADYQTRNAGKQNSQQEMLRKLELSHDEYVGLVSYAHNLGCDIFSAAFDEEAVDFLESIRQTTWKIPSGEITNLPYLERIRDIKQEGKEIILSTGMATMSEIESAVTILKAGCPKITVLHCNTDYPTKDCDVNLSAISHLGAHFSGIDIGLSDHSVGFTAALVACGLGITMIEKHFTLDKNLPGPDHKASASPDEFRILCSEVRRAEVMLGTRGKIVTQSEAINKPIARKSIVAKTSIKKGTRFSAENLTCKRPGTGINPMRWHDLIGKTAEKDFALDELIVCNGFDMQKDVGNER